MRALDAIGLLDHKVDIETRVVKRTDTLGTAQTWTKKVRNWKCRLEALSAREAVFHEREGVRVTHSMKGRCSKAVIAALDEKARIVDRDGKVYGVQGVIDLGGRKRLLSVVLEEKK